MTNPNSLLAGHSVAITPAATVCAKIQTRQHVEDIAAAIDDALELMKPLAIKIVGIKLHALILERKAEGGELPTKGPLPERQEVRDTARAIAEDDIADLAGAIEALAELTEQMPADWLSDGAGVRTVQVMLREDTVEAATTATLLLLDDIESMAETIAEDDTATPTNLRKCAEILGRLTGEVQGNLERLAELIREPRAC